VAAVPGHCLSVVYDWCIITAFPTWPAVTVSGHYPDKSALVIRSVNVHI
jgi:hypothetical protein